MTTLSDKVTATVAALGLTGKSFVMPEIEWKQEMRMVRADVTCPECDGTRHCRYDADLKPIVFVGNRDSSDYTAYRKAARDEANRSPSYGSCRKCTVGGYSYGTIKGAVEKLVEVGRVIWPEGTKHDSRFSWCDCNACGKNNITSNRVPMYATDDAGVPHAMWLGVDCASKFFALSREAKKLVKTEGKFIGR